MTTSEPTRARNLDGYGAPPIEWDRVREVLGTTPPQAPGTGGPDRHTCWLATIAPDGRPHVVGIGCAFVDGDVYFTASPRSRKARNLAADARCSLTLATEPFDLTIEGEGARVTDEATVARVSATMAADGWPNEARGAELHGAYSAQSAGPPPWYVYRVTPSSLIALGTTGAGGAMRFDF
jgi:Pyridoxamine 5'-phosphate oxidase